LAKYTLGEKGNNLGETSETKLWTRNFIAVSASNFFLFMSFYFLLVTLPVYVVNDLGASKSSAGLLTTAFLLAAIIIRPFSGRLIEKYGGRKMLITALILFLATTLFYFAAHTVNQLLIVRLIHGLSFGMATTAAGSIVADIIPEKRRGEGMGYFILSSSLAMVIGPYLGLTSMQSGGITVMLIIAFVASLGGSLAGFAIAKPKKEVESPKEPAKFTTGSLFEKSALPIAITGAFFAIVYSSILSFISVYADEVHLGHVASFFFVVYAFVLLVSRPFTGKWFDQFGANIIVFPGIVVFAIGMFVLSQANSAFIFLLAAGFIGLGWGTLFPTFQTLAIQSAPPKRRAMATATFLSVFDMGIGLGSYLVGLVAAGISFSQLYFYGSFYVLLGMGVYIYLNFRKSASKKAETAYTELDKQVN
jgi:MFS family permease